MSRPRLLCSQTFGRNATMRMISTIKTRMMPIILIIALVFSYVIVPPKKAEAIAPVLAGGAAAALAADLGISVEALMAATVAVVGVGTGYAVVKSGTTERGWANLGNPYNTGIGQESDWWPEYQNGSHNIGDLPAWEDLTPEQQAEYGNPRTYTKAQWDWLWLQMGLIQDNGNGDYEPTPEPEDPDEKKNWQKGRNILTLLGVGAGTVTVSEASQWLADTIGQGLRNLLYGNGEQSLDLVYQSIADVNGVQVPVRTQTVLTNDTFQITGLRNRDLTTAWSFMQVVIDETGEKDYGWVARDANNAPIVITPLNFNRENARYKCVTTSYNASQMTNYVNSLYNQKYWMFSGGGTPTPYVGGVSNNYNALNANYLGVYDFGNGITFEGGSWHNASLVSESYGQMGNTPLGLGQAINSGSGYPGFMQGVTQNASEGFSNTVNVPSTLLNPNPESTGLVSGISDYLDYLKPVPDTEIVPVPDDTPVNPDPNPNPNPSPELGFSEDLTEEVSRLLRQPFDQLFPFCLIGDLERLVNMIKEVGTESDNTVNGTSTLILPLSDFGISGADNMEFNLSLVSELAVYVRPFLTALFITGLLVGTFAFFLKRGGE